MTNDAGFKAFYNGRTCEVHAPSMYQAKLKAIAVFKPRKSQEHMVSVVCCERPDGSQVVHSTSEF